MSLLLGLYWAVGSNLTVEITQDLTEGGGFCVAHQQIFALKIFSTIAEKIKGKGEGKKLVHDHFKLVHYQIKLVHNQTAPS